MSTDALPVSFLPTSPAPTPAPETDPADGGSPCAPVGVLWLAIADFAAQQALSFFGRRGLKALGRGVRRHENHLTDLDSAEWYLHFPDLDPDTVLEILNAGAFTYFDNAVRHADPAKAACVRGVLMVYLRTIIVTRLNHDRANLARALASNGCLEIPAAA